MVAAHSRRLFARVTTLVIVCLLGSAPLMAQPDAQTQETVRAQRQRFLAQKYLEQAKQLERSGKLQEAKALLLRAQELDKANPDVKSALDSILAQLGERGGTVETYAQQMAKVQRIREERARAEVMDLLQTARNAIREQRNDAAVEAARQALLQTETLRGIDWGDLPGQAQAVLEAAKKGRDETERVRQAEIERDILRQRRMEQRDQLARERAMIDGWLEAGMRAFRSSRFELARDYAFQAMQVDPANQIARDLHAASIKAARDANASKYTRSKSQQYRRMMEAAEELRVPQSDILRTDPLVWDRAMRRSMAASIGADEDPDDAAVRGRLASETIKTTFTEETGTYPEVVKFIRAQTGIPILITPEAASVINDASLTMQMELRAPISVENFLDLMAQKSPDLAWAVRNGVVELTTRTKAGGKNVLRNHDIRDLVFPMTTFKPPIIRDIPSGDAGVGGPRIGSEDEEKIAAVEPDALVSNIKASTGGDTYWDAEGGGTMEYVDGGYLLVRANAKMQRDVEQFLNDQRRFSTSVVTIESKFLTITNNFLQEIGVDFRGLGGSGNKGVVASLDDITNKLDDNASRGLDNQGTGEDASHPTAGAFFNDGQDGDVRARTENFFGSSLGQALNTSGGATAAISLLDDLQLQMLITAVEKRQNVQVVNSQILTVLNNSRANVAVINQTSYVRDFDVEVAQASFIADPRVDVIQDGIVLDVQPTIAHDRKHITLTLQPTVAELVRPIPTFTTSLAGSTLPVTLQLPVLNVRSFSTTAQVPDGGSVLIGGLREVLSKERRASVPILSKLPLISFFFKQEGIVDENSSLTVLVTARVTDVADLVSGR